MQILLDLEDAKSTSVIVDLETRGEEADDAGKVDEDTKVEFKDLAETFSNLSLVE